MNWTLDKAHTSIGFSAKHMMFSTVRGTFTNFDGTVNIDEQNPQNSSVEVTVQLDSITTNDERRDGHLRSPDFFHTENHPTMTFKSTSIEGSDLNHFKLHGDLTIKGETHPLVLNVTKEGEAKHPFTGSQVMAYSAEGTINRKDWGLNWNVALEAGGWLVSDQIKITVETELAEQVAAPAVVEAPAETASAAA
jgi:polyisoprenoid-binding protein YceI